MEGEQQKRRGLALEPAVRAYLLGRVLLGVAHAVPWTLLALYLDRLGYTKTEIGIVQSGDAWGKVVIGIPAAIFLARKSARPIFVTAALLAGAAFIMLPRAAEYGVAYAVALNFLGGLGFSVHYVAVAPFLFRHTRLPERAFVFGLTEAVGTFAAVIGAFGAGRFVAWFAQGVGGETAALAFAISGGGTVALLGAIAFARLGGDAPALERGAPLLPVLREHRGLLLRFAVPQFVIASGAGFCIPFLSLYFQDRFGFSPGDWSTLFSSGQVLMTTGFLLSSWILARLGFVRSILAVEIASTPFFLLLAFTHSPELAIFAYLMRGALMNAAHPILKNFMMHTTPPGARELQTGINATLWGVGWVFGPILAGRVLEATGDDYAVLMLTTVGFYIVAACLTWALLGPIDESRRKRKRESAQGSPGAD